MTQITPVGLADEQPVASVGWPKTTLKQLAVFVQVYQTGSTSAASERLHLSQSAISSALAALESRLQLLLFERIGRRLLPHPNAKQVYQQAQALLAQAQQLEQWHVHQHGQIYLAASTTIGNYVLPEIVAALYQRLPKADVAVTVANTQTVVAQVERLQVDVGMVEGMPHPQQINVIEQRAWRTDQLVVFAKTNSRWLTTRFTAQYEPQHHRYRLSATQLATLPLIVRETGSGTRQIIDAQLLAQLPNPWVRLAIEQSEAVKNMVLADVGVGCLSLHVVKDALDRGELVRLEVAGLDLSRTWWLIWHQARHQSPIFQQFLQLLGEGDSA